MRELNFAVFADFAPIWKIWKSSLKIFQMYKTMVKFTERLNFSHKVAHTKLENRKVKMCFLLYPRWHITLDGRYYDVLWRLLIKRALNVFYITTLSANERTNSRRDVGFRITTRWKFSRTTRKSIGYWF